MDLTLRMMKNEDGIRMESELESPHLTQDIEEFIGQQRATLESLLQAGPLTYKLSSMRYENGLYSFMFEGEGPLADAVRLLDQAEAIRSDKALLNQAYDGLSEEVRKLLERFNVDSLEQIAPVARFNIMIPYSAIKIRDHKYYLVRAPASDVPRIISDGPVLSVEESRQIPLDDVTEVVNLFSAAYFDYDDDRLSGELRRMAEGYVKSAKADGSAVTDAVWDCYRKKKNTYQLRTVEPELLELMSARSVSNSLLQGTFVQLLDELKDRVRPSDEKTGTIRYSDSLDGNQLELMANDTPFYMFDPLFRKDPQEAFEDAVSGVLKSDYLRIHPKAVDQSKGLEGVMKGIDNLLMKLEADPSRFGFLPHDKVVIHQAERCPDHPGNIWDTSSGTVIRRREDYYPVEFEDGTCLRVRREDIKYYPALDTLANISPMWHDRPELAPGVTVLIKPEKQGKGYHPDVVPMLAERDGQFAKIVGYCYDLRMDRIAFQDGRSFKSTTNHYGLSQAVMRKESSDLEAVAGEIRKNIMDRLIYGYMCALSCREMFLFPKAGDDGGMVLKAINARKGTKAISILVQTPGQDRYVWSALNKRYNDFNSRFDYEKEVREILGNDSDPEKKFIDLLLTKSSLMEFIHLPKEGKPTVLQYTGRHPL
ncbi:MAG: hypothetical protein KJ709_00195 [Nanoarchaeota archaeon]|nr:hypothetical protein [Nanoarchaeota archaeon]